MERKNTLDKIVGAIHSIAPDCHTDFSLINEQTRFIEDLDLDSINLLMLASSLEELFNVKPSDKDISSVKTVGDVVDYVMAKSK